MKRSYAYLLTMAVVAVTAFGAGAWWTSRSQAVSTSSARAASTARYTCPMHPDYTSDHPGDCPICGMRLVQADTGGGTSQVSKTAVNLPLDRRQLIGVHTIAVTREPVQHLLRVSGRVAIDDNRLYRVIAASEGWTRTLGPNPTGTYVRKGEQLASYYAPNLQASQQSLLFNMANSSQVQVMKNTGAVAGQNVPVPLNVQIAIDSLRGLGMSEQQIAEIQHSGQFANDIAIYAPVSGFVIARSLSPEQRFDKGSELYRIADVSRVWVMTDIFENDGQFLKPGTTATVLHQGRRYEARMSDAVPQFDPQSRTFKTRFELANPDFVLRPDMFVDVELRVEMPPAIVVPSDAVFDSGLRKTVFVERGNDSFEPRRVETGWRLGDRVQIVRGLMEGDRIAASSNFLLDSESRMKASAAGIYNAETDPVCGMDVDHDAARNAGRTASRGGETFYFCSDDCKKKFQADPGKYTTADGERREGEGSMGGHSHAAPSTSKVSMNQGSAAKPAASTAAKDPVCGMDVDPKDATASGLTAAHGGTTYYFCSDDCKKKFTAEPGKYQKK